MSEHTSQGAPRPDLDAVTVYTSVDRQPINKIVKRAPDGEITTKGMIEHRQHYWAETRAVRDDRAFAALLVELGGRPDMMLSTALFLDPPAPRWQSWSTSRMARQRGCASTDRAKLLGWRTCRASDRRRRG